jgi:hypothetical protein
VANADAMRISGLQRAGIERWICGTSGVRGGRHMGSGLGAGDCAAGCAQPAGESHARSVQG